MIPRQFIKEYRFVLDAQEDIDHLAENWRGVSIATKSNSPYDSSIIVLFEERV